jgi:UDP-hydrolysing UDP-N-acetyl-D-glucosamine 2-epimerase
LKSIAVVTCARSDFGLYLPLVAAIREHPELDLKIIATGSHLSARFGLTVNQIEAEGFHVDERVESLVDSDKPEAISESIGNGVVGFSRLFARWRPDILVVLGDRFDMFPAALAALPLRIPVAHLFGGELTEGAIDDALRHSLTKLSHLHFVALEEYADRVRQMGEEPWRVTVSGALAVDNLRTMQLWSQQETARRFGFELNRPVALVTFHPVTLEYDHTRKQINNLLAALERTGIQCLFTYPNADTAGREVINAIELFCKNRVDRRVIINAGQTGYFSLMNTVSVMVGNSSSGIIEAPSFKLPVVNIGARQAGRVYMQNVIHCPPNADDIYSALQRALTPQFRESLHDLKNRYGDGHAAERIVDKLAALDLGKLIPKKFVDTSR